MSEVPGMRSAGDPLAAPAGWYPSDGGLLRYWDGWQWTEHVRPMTEPDARVYYPVRPGGRPDFITDARPNSTEIALAWVFTVLTLGYLLPWAIAATRGKSNSLAIGLLNFLLGWTVVGWLVAFVMACLPHQVVAVRD